MKPASHHMTLLLAIATLGACGGSNPAPAAPAADPPSAGDGASTTPFDAEGVRATVASMGVPHQCATGDGTPATLGELLEQNRSLLGEAGTEVTFTCSPPSEEQATWSCMWAATNAPVGPRNPDDPNEGEGEGSAFQIMMQVNADGSLVPGSIGCIAAG
jgi:predicted small lipoprotein YifL